jgi:hypothetical protein
LVVGGVIFLRFNPTGHFWGGVEPPKAQAEAYDPVRLAQAKNLTTEIYSLTALNRLVREPQNTISNLAYLFTGLAILRASVTTVGQSLGLACGFLAVGSGIYHASLLPEWRLIDILGVYAVLFTAVFLGCCTFRPRWAHGRQGFVTAAAIWVTALAAGIFRNDVRIFGFKLLDSTYVVVGLVTLGVSLAIFAWGRVAPEKHRGYRFALGAVAVCSTIAFAGGLGDRFGGFYCNPEGLVQGHALWHTFGGLALLSVYEVFASTGVDRSTFSHA